MTIAHMRPDWEPAPRQAETLRLVAQGYTVDQIAKRMYVSRNTIKKNLTVLREATSTTNNAALVYRAIKKGWLI